MYKSLLERKRKGEKLDFAFVGDRSLYQLYILENCSVEMLADLFSVPVYEVTAQLARNNYFNEDKSLD